MVPDEQVPWIKFMMGLLEPSEALKVLHEEPLELGELFTPPEFTRFPVKHTISPHRLIDWLETRSDMNNFSTERRDAVFEAINWLIDHDPTFINKTTIEFPFVAYAMRTRLV
jgi:hypothetical protein